MLVASLGAKIGHHASRLFCLVVGVLLLEAPRAHGQPASVRFAAIGDFGRAGQAARDVANLVKSWKPDFVITLGDNNYPRGAASTIDENIGQYYHDFIHPYRGRYGAGAAANQFFPSLGNHDWRAAGARPYLDYFTLPGNERYYDVSRGPVHFFAIDSDDQEPDGATSDSAQAVWLQRRLAAATEHWKLVYFHHPPYSSGRHGSTPRMRWPIRKWGATAVLSGHDLSTSASSWAVAPTSSLAREARRYTPSKRPLPVAECATTATTARCWSRPASRRSPSSTTRAPARS